MLLEHVVNIEERTLTETHLSRLPSENALSYLLQQLNSKS